MLHEFTQKIVSSANSNKFIPAFIEAQPTYFVGKKVLFAMIEFYLFLESSPHQIPSRSNNQFFDNANFQGNTPDEEGTDQQQQEHRGKYHF